MSNNNTTADPNDAYSEEQLQEALASLAYDDLPSGATLASQCKHIHGFDPNSPSFFQEGHKLSMLQKITARRILDYSNDNDNDKQTEAQLLSKAEEFHETNGQILNLLTQIQSQSPSMALAAEFKRASPSKGLIASNVDIQAGDQALIYASAGASTISILTERHWFKGSLADMTQARITTGEYAAERSATRPVILRKDFCISTYMISEALAHGADTILLIVAITPSHLLERLISHARDVCKMEPLVEVHGEGELEVALECGARVIGVNNRNLHTFKMDLGVTDRAAEEMEKLGCTFKHDISTNGEEKKEGEKKGEYALCALSGMSNASDVDRYRHKGVGMCLIGESLMRAADPKAAIEALCLHPTQYHNYTTNSNPDHRNGTMSMGAAYTHGTKIVKVCGITDPNDAICACTNGANLIGLIFAPKSKRCVSAVQATAVVRAVRSFGERDAPIDFTDHVDEEKMKRMKPLHALASKARVLEGVSSRRPLVVGVFQNQSEEFIRRTVEECGLDLVQLHGKEGMEAANVKRCGGVPALRVVDIMTNRDGGGGGGDEGVVENILKSITTDPIAILLDTSIKGAKEGGGTGVTFDWSIASRLQSHGLPVLIAGGLSPENVKEAVGVGEKSVRPWGVDVSSGVEMSPGKKDLVKVKDFVCGARAAAVESSKGF